MRVFPLISLLLLATFYCFSQEHFTIYGAVLDKHNRQPLPNATISIKGISIGTNANNLGEFEFHIPKRYFNDTLVISMLGYESYQEVINHLPSNIKILLTQKPIILNEVIFRNKNLGAEEILKKAVANIRLNYPAKPYVKEGFFRQTQTIDDEFVSILETAINIYDQGYSSNKKEEVAIVEIRRSHYLNPKKYLNIADTSFTQKVNTLLSTLKHNAVRSIASSGKSNGFYRGKHFYKWDTTLYFDGRPTYVISATQKANRGYLKKIQHENRINTILIDAETFAIVKVAFKYSPKDDYDPSEFRNVTDTNDSIVSMVTGHTHSYEFSNYGGRYYLKYIRWSDRVLDYNLRTRKVAHTNEYRHELLINKIVTDPNDFPGLKVTMDPGISLHLQEKSYNEAFWKSYNVIYESPRERELINKLLLEISKRKIKKRP